MIHIIAQSKLQSHGRCSVRKGVFRNFVKFTGKQLKPTTLLKMRLWHRCFPVNFAKFLRIPCLTEHIRWLLLKGGTKLYFTRNSCAVIILFNHGSIWVYTSLHFLPIYLENLLFCLSALFVLTSFASNLTQSS